MSVDEQMIPFKGKNKLKQYIPKKPKNGALKSWHGVVLVESPMIFICVMEEDPKSSRAVAINLETLS